MSSINSINKPAGTIAIAYFIGCRGSGFGGGYTCIELGHINSTSINSIMNSIVMINPWIWGVLPPMGMMDSHTSWCSLIRMKLINKPRAWSHRMGPTRKEEGQRPRGFVIDKIGDRYIASFIIGREVVFVWARSLEELKELLKREFGIEVGEVRVRATAFQPSPS